MKQKIKSSFNCSPDCPECEGKAFVVVGMEGFINHKMEQDCRDVIEPCSNATFKENYYPEKEE